MTHLGAGFAPECRRNTAGVCPNHRPSLPLVTSTCWSSSCGRLT